MYKIVLKRVKKILLLIQYLHNNKYLHLYGLTEYPIPSPAITSTNTFNIKDYGARSEEVV